MRTGNTNHAEPIANNTEPAYILHKIKNVSCETELTMRLMPDSRTHHIKPSSPSCLYCLSPHRPMPLAKGGLQRLTIAMNSAIL